MINKYCRALTSLVLLSSVVSGQSVEEFDTVMPDTKVKSVRQQTSPRANLSQVAEMIVEQTNAFRKKQELRPLKVDAKLAETAQYFANFMARTKKYGHHADEKTPSERADEHGYDFCIVLENIGFAFRSTGFEESTLTNKFVEGWKNSEGHRENMVDSDIVETGVAVARSEEEPQYFAVQMFGRPHSKAIRFQITNVAGEEVEYTVSRKNKEQSFTLPPRATRTHTQCRPSHLDLSGTKEDDKLQVRDGRKFLVSKEAEGLQVTASKSEDLAQPAK